jgi:hypothetical protein
MLIKNLPKENNKVYFNPLIPLNKSIINRIPENIRVLEFFNKGLFDSLINLHGVKKENLPTLEEARNRGIIDNNIKITLDILFPVGTKIYVDNNAYTIVDNLWSNGAWKLDAKPLDLRLIQPENLVNPFTYNKYILEQFKEGKKELQNISETAKYGPNFDKTSEITPETELQIKEVQPEKPEKPVPQAPKNEKQESIVKPSVKSLVPLIEDIPTRQVPLIENVPINKPVPLIENSNIVPESEKVEEIIDSQKKDDKKVYIDERLD